jgi:hypothetical protein
LLSLKGIGFYSLSESGQLPPIFLLEKNSNN